MFNASEMISSTILLCVLVIVFDTIESSAFGQHIRVSVEPQKFLEFKGLNVSNKFHLDNIFVSALAHTHFTLSLTSSHLRYISDVTGIYKSTTVKSRTTFADKNQNVYHRRECGDCDRRRFYWMNMTVSNKHAKFIRHHRSYPQKNRRTEPTILNE